MRKNVTSIVMTMMMVLVCVFTGCSTESVRVDNINVNPLRTDVNYIEELIEASDSVESVDELPEELKKDIKHLKIKDLGDNIQISSDMIPTVQLEKVKRFTPWEYKNVKPCKIIGEDIINLEKTRIIDFIDKTGFFEDKETLKNYIQDLPFLEGIPDDDSFIAKSSNAIYSAEDDAIYICSKDADLLREMSDHVIAHELMHALCTKCNGGDGNKRFPNGIWDEIMTDLLTCSLGCYQSSSYATLYSQYFDFALRAINCKGEKIIKAYFYGYNEFSPKELKEIDALAAVLDFAGWPDENGDGTEEQIMAINIACMIALSWAI